MTIQNLKKTVLLSICILMMFSSCDSTEEETENNEPVVIENYFFKGKLDDKELNIEKKIYESPLNNEPDSILIDFGGSQTNDIEDFGGTGTGFCYGRYACGILMNDFIDNLEKTDTAKMYFSRIPVDACELEKEISSMKEFFDIKNYKYDRFQAKDILNNVALDFFPADVEDGQRIYYSSRFGDNTDASFEIKSTKELENGVFIVEGDFSCKLYQSKDDTDFKVLKDGTFKIKISSNLKE